MKKITLLITFFAGLLGAFYFVILVSAAKTLDLPFNPLHALGILILLLFALRIAGMMPDR